MVKSYRGVAQAKPKKVVPSMQVGDYMTRRLITFRPDQTMDQVIKILTTKRISGGPVVDEHHQLVGIISEGDCLKEVVRGKYTNTPKLSGHVEDHMTRDVQFIHPDMNIFELAHLFLRAKLRRFPVLKEGRLVGQISQQDVMRAVYDLKNETW